MRRFISYVLMIAAIGITTAGGVLHGTLSERWGKREDLSATAERLTSFPANFGHWKLRQSDPIPDATRSILQCTGYMNRQYVHDETGELVSVAIMLGPSGPISVHTPEVCYSSRDYQQRGRRKVIPIRDAKGNESQFWSVTFDSVGLEKSILRTYYGWSVTGKWAADESPRVRYAGQPHLFKIQLAATLPSDADLSKDDSCERFLSEFVPAMNDYVFATDQTAKKNTTKN